jgi:hypothetical protein
MVEPKVIGLITLIVGLALAALGLFADKMGIGVTPGVIGEYQWIGLTSGAILFIMGFTILLFTTGNPKNGSA